MGYLAVKLLCFMSFDEKLELNCAQMIVVYFNVSIN